MAAEKSLLDFTVQPYKYGSTNAGTGAYRMWQTHNGTLTAERTLTWNLNDANRTVSLAGNVTFAGAVTTSGAYSLTVTLTNTTTVTFPTTGTLATLAGAESLTNKKLGSLTTNGLVTTSSGDGTLSVTVPGANVLTFLATPSSANLAAALTDEVGTSNVAFQSASTFTPSLTFGGGSTGMTYSVQQGVYKRIGDVVFAIINITLTAKGSSTGNMLISGLPFTAIANSFAASLHCTAITSGTGDTTLEAIVLPSTSTVRIDKIATGNATPLTHSDFTDTSVIRLTMVYFV